ncbi:hypoxanthine phosphoribosyltransferase [Ruminococcaceae bacterium YRB3002]|nr:hypoxanthine phosphoribosyltransferase [Ruminococcaceae bacterium YRB3002]
MNADTSKVLITDEQINEMLDRVSSEINRDYEGRELVVIGILTGAYIFTADLTRRLTMPVNVDFMQVSSYQGTRSTGILTIRKDLTVDVQDQDVLVVEDIIDTGRTLALLREELYGRGAKSVKLCAAFDKPARRIIDIVPDYRGIVVPDEFIVGYGLDYNGQFRNIKNVRICEVIDGRPE